MSELWILFCDVHDPTGSTLGEVAGAFVHVVALAPSSTAAVHLVEQELESIGLKTVDLGEPVRYSDQYAGSVPLPEIVRARRQARKAGVGLGDFHVYPMET